MSANLTSGEYLFTAAFFAYLISAFMYIFLVFGGYSKISKLSTAFLYCGIICHLGAVGERYLLAGYAPMSNMFESLSVFSLLIAAAYAFTEYRYKIKVIGPFAVAMAFIMIAIASVLPRDIKPLVPALQSYWLGLHVFVTFIGEAAFAISYIAAILYLIAEDTAAINNNDTNKKNNLKEINIKYSAKKFETFFASLNAGTFIGIITYFSLMLLSKKNIIKSEYSFSAEIIVIAFIISGAAFYLSAGKIRQTLPPAETLDDISYQSICVGLPLFTLGALIFGAIWAQKAWGAYWSWDPKETWALITWFIYMIYLHMRYRIDLKGKAAAYITILGFASTMFTYFGVNYLLTGLHSYGKF